MTRYMITKTLLSAWLYTFDCAEDSAEEAKEEFLRTLRREKTPPTPDMENGLAFEREVYAEAAGLPRVPHNKWEPGIRAVAEIIKGAPVQVRAKREIEVGGTKFLVYGILDALKAGTIYDVKFRNKSLGSAQITGKYLQSPQHPTYFFLVPGATEFQYLVSDGNDMYIETYFRDDATPMGNLISEFIHSVDHMGLLGLYEEFWATKEEAVC